MNSPIATKFAAKFAALGLAAMVTLSVLVGLTALAQSEQHSAAQLAQQQAQKPA